METIGSLIDKITILDLKIFHMSEQIQLKSNNKQHIKNCRERVVILRNQRDDLVIELNSLFRDIKDGKKSIKIYRQFKMYNDPSYKLSSK